MNTYKEKDYHGFSVIQALSDIHNELFRTEHPKNSKLSLIVGHGEIKEVLIEILNDNKLEWTYDKGNEGCILIKF